MLGTIISAVIGGGGGFLGGMGIESMIPSLASSGGLSNIVGPVSGILGGGAIGGLMGRGGDAAAAGAAAAGGGFNPKQLIGGLAGGAGAGAIGQSVLGLVGG